MCQKSAAPMTILLLKKGEAADWGQIGVKRAGVFRNFLPRELRWSWFFDQLSAAISYGIGFMSGGGFQVRVLAIIGLRRGKRAMR